MADGALPSDTTWDVSKEYNTFTASTRIDDLNNLSSVSSRILFVDSDFAFHDENERVQLFNMDLVENEDGNFVLSGKYEGDLRLRTEKVELATGRVLGATPLQTWNGSRTFSPEEVALSPGEALVIVVTWKI